MFKLNLGPVSTFRSNNLSVLAYANNFTQWHYLAEEKLEVLLQRNYFGQAASMLRKGDLIIVNAADFNTALWVSEARSITGQENFVKVTKHSIVGE